MAGLFGEVSFVAELSKQEISLLKALNETHYSFRTDYEIIDDKQVAFHVMVANPFGQVN